jgi:amino acid transporter
MAFARDEKHASGSDVERPHSPDCGEGEEIKRDLKSRHINMIAIAGMIVGSLFYPCFDRRTDTNS